MTWGPTSLGSGKERRNFTEGDCSLGLYGVLGYAELRRDFLLRKTIYFSQCQDLAATSGQ
jgi:hypothetical protein